MTPGERLFARYAYAPNDLGYCGPLRSAQVRAMAVGEDVGVDARQIARQFSGVWPYSVILAQQLGIDDPLDERVQRAYWTGSAELDHVDNTDFGERLLEWIGAQAGHYWQHLTPELMGEARPTHAFHVFGIYPWSRLLSTGLPEPVRVLDSCRITPAAVTEVGDQVRVRRRRIGYRNRQLVLLEESDEPATVSIDEGSFVDELAVGDLVTVHWDQVCERLSASQAEQLASTVSEQLDLTNRRLAR